MATVTSSTRAPQEAPAAPTPRRAAPRRGPAWLARRFLVVFGLLIALLALWQLVATTNPSPFVPSPSQILNNSGLLFLSGPPSHLWLTDDVFQDALPTLGRCLLGFAFGALWGVFLGTVIGLSRVFRYTTSYVVEFLRAVPGSALLPLFIVVFGGTDATRVAFVAYSISWYVMINTANGVGSVDPTLLMVGRAFRLSRASIIRRIVLPAASPQIYAGLRIATNGALILTIISEFILASKGIGYQILYNQGIFNTLDMWSWILLLAVFGLVLNSAVEAIERRLLAWHRNSH